MTGIYRIISPTGRIYVGQSVDMGKRFENYRQGSYLGQTRLKNSMLKYGINLHSFEILEECKIEELNERERYWQEFYDVIGRNGLNCKLTKTEDKSGKNSEESNLQRSKTMKEKGYKPPSRLGCKMKDSTINLIRQKATGRGHSEETRNKISNNKKGKPNGRAKGVLKFNLDGTLLQKFRTTKEAGESVNRSQTNIQAACKGVTETCAGFIWKYST